MALVAVAPVTGIRTASTEVALRASAALTGSYVATTNHVLAIGWEFAIVKITYTKGDETTLEMEFDGSCDGSTWWPLLRKETPSSGFAAVTADDVQVTGSLTGALPPVSLQGHAYFRCRVKATGGAPTGTLAVAVSLGRYAYGS